jgi:uncharacterized protein YidB (DUF937 family)
LTFSHNILVGHASHSTTIATKGGEVMGLIDVLNGMQNGPHGPRGSSGSSSGGGMSPITMAILGLLAFKALRSFTSQPGTATSAPTAPTTSTRTPSAPAQSSGSGDSGGLGDILKNALGGSSPTQAGSSGGLGDILKGGLGGLLGGGAAGTVLSGGLNDLLKQFQEAGHGEATNSWVGNGPNKTISSDDLAKALGADQINTLAAHSGLSRDELLAGLSQYLPDVVNHLTPDGRLPTEHEVSRAL